MGIFTRKLTRPDGTELEVDGSFRILGGCIEDLEGKAWLYADRNNPDAPYVTLTDDDWNQLHDELVNDESTWEYPSYD